MHVCGGGAAHLRACTVSQFEDGVFATGRSSRFQLTASAIEECGGGCVIRQRAVATLENACVRAGEVPGRDPESPVYAAVAVGTSHAQLVRCEVLIRGVVATVSAVQMYEGGRGSLQLCRLESDGSGLNVSEPALACHRFAV